MMESGEMHEQRVLVFDSRFVDRVRAFSKGAYTVVGAPEGEDRHAWLTRYGRGIRIAIAISSDKVDATTLDLLPDLEHIQVLSAGMEAIELDELARRGITIANSSAIHASETADLAMALMLAARRDVLTGDHWVREDRWTSEGPLPPSRSLFGAKIGIAGLGHIGEAIARRVEPFCPDIGWWGPRPKPGVPWRRHKSLLALAQAVEILFVAVRAHNDTRGLVTGEIIDALGPDGLLVNITRGFVVDEDALIAALNEGRLGQAALDVFETEPTPASRWKGVPNALLTPHFGGNTASSHARLDRYADRKVREFLDL